MGKIAAYLLAGIVVGVGFAWWQGIGRSEVGIGSDGLPADGGSLEARLSELETELSLERFERQVLADELADLRASVEAMPAGSAINFDELREQLGSLRDPNNPDNPMADRIRQRFPNGVPQTPEEFEAYQRQEQMNRYIAAGLTPDRAQWIMNRENELEMEVLQTEKRDEPVPEEIFERLSREEKSTLNYEAISRRGSFAEEDVLGQEKVPWPYRSLVRRYFLSIVENSETKSESGSQK